MSASQSLNIAYVVPGMGIGGGPNVILEHASRLMNRGHRVVLLSTGGPNAAEWHPIASVPTYDLSSIWTLRWLASQALDIIVVTGWQTVYELLRLRLRARQFVYFVQCNEIPFNPRGSWDWRLSSLTYQLPFHYLTISRWLYNWLSSQYGQKAFYVPNRYNPQVVHEVEPLEPRRPDRLRILLEGPLSNPWKRMEDAFLAVQGVDAEVWCLSGAGELRPWQRPDRFFSALPYGEVKRVMSSCDLLVKLSEIEGFFGPPLEMMACGGTAVVSRVAGYDEYVVDGYNALVVDIGDYRGARKKLRQLIENRQLLERLKAGGVETASRFSNWEESIDKIENFYLGLVEPGARIQEFEMPDLLSHSASLAVDVRFSRHSDNPKENRRNWTTMRSFMPVCVKEIADPALIEFRGRCIDGLRNCELDCIVVPGAMNSDSKIRPQRVAPDLVISDGGSGQPYIAFSVRAVLVVPPGFESTIAGCRFASAREFPNLCVHRIDTDGESRRLPFIGDNTLSVNPSTPVAPGLVEEVRGFSGYRIEVDIPVSNWPAEQGDNYAAILGFFCDRAPENVILHGSPGNSLHYPPIRVESVDDNSQGVYVLVDTIGVYLGEPRYDFVMFVDKNLRVSSPFVSPGCL